MIEPTYRRDQLWDQPRRGVHSAIVLGGCAGLVVTILTIVTLAAPRTFGSFAESRHSRAETLVTNLVYAGFPHWRTHHAGCPHRLAELLPNVRLDPWGHAMHFTCDPRLGLGAHFAVISAGEDGTFGTADDIEAHQ